MCLLPDCPKNIEISGARNGSTLVEGTTLRCAGESHPAPSSHRWTNDVDDTTAEGETFTVAAVTKYRLTCTVTNTVLHANGTSQTCSGHGYFLLQGNQINYTPWAIKNVPLLFLRELWQMWTDFNNSFTLGFVNKLRKMVK